jgi:proteasome accessory factor C
MSPHDRERPHRTSATDRVARLLAIVPWIAANDGPTLDEISARFGVPRKKLAEDLEVLMLVGVPPYTPDAMIEVSIEGDRVWLRFADVFARPLRLTPEQALALVVAGAASHELPGAEPAGPLATALAKLAGVLGVDPGENLSVTLGTTQPGLLETLRSAVADQRRVRIDYYAYGRDERTTREVDPHEVFAHEGSWYLRGWCHLARAPRSFRVDRVVEADVLDGPVTHPVAEGEGAGLDIGPEVPRVTLEVAPSARWVIETYAVDEVDEVADGWLRVRLPVTATPWLERLLVRLGDDARLLATDDPALEDAGPVAARRILARYGRA